MSKVRREPETRRFRRGTFLMTPAQHQARAELLRKVGNDELARHHEDLAKAIAWRWRVTVESPSVVPQLDPTITR